MPNQTLSTDNRLRLALACVLLGLYLLVYVPRINSADGEAILAVTASTLRHGVPDIGVMGADDALQPFDSSRMGTFGPDGAYYSKKGVTPSLALVPLVLLADVLPWLDTRATAMLFNPLVATATALCLYTFARWLAYRPRTAFALALIYGAATFAITYVKTLFGEPLAALLLLGAVMAAYQFRQDGSRRALLAAGVCAGLMPGVNLVYIAIVPLLALYIADGFPLSRRKIASLAAFFMPIIAALTLLGIYDWARFGSPLNTGYHFTAGEGFTRPLLEGIYGLTLSPYRGLFWYNPLLLLTIPGWLMVRRKTPRLAWLILALVILQILSFAAWWSWDGGIVWGPRFLLTVAPLLALCLAPLVEAAWGKWGIAAALSGLTLLSFGIQLLGSLYTVFPFIGYLYYRYYIPELPGLSSEVLTNPGISAILGHLAMALDRWPLEPAWAANGVDGLYLAAVLALLLAGILILRTTRLSCRAFWGAILAIIVSLNVAAARQQGSSEAGEIQALESALQPPGMVVAETTHFGESLLDLKNGSWALSTNAPTSPDDPLTVLIWNYGIGKSGNFWLLTWFRPGDPANWQERDLWTRGAFAFEREVAGHRALLFNLSPMPPPDHDTGVQFGLMTLQKYGVIRFQGGLLVSLQWAATSKPDQDFSWFVHLIDERGNVLAQQDRQPQGGYAPTSTWKPGEMVMDHLFFPGVKGDGLSLRLGWVDSASGERLPTIDSSGKTVPDGYIVLPMR